MALDPHKPPMSLKESEDLLKGHADTERTKSDWSFLGRSALFFVAMAILAVSIIAMFAGWFR